MQKMQKTDVLYVGMVVAVKGLKEGRHYNGLRGELLEFCSEIQRWYVRVMATPTAVLRIRSENLKIDEQSWKNSHSSKADFLKWRKGMHDFYYSRRASKVALSKMTAKETLDDTWLTLPHSRFLKMTFLQLQSLWDKYGTGYTRWFESLTEDEAVAAICDCKHQFIRSMGISGSPASRHVPAPAGIASNTKCLLPELQTRGPNLDGLSQKEILEETQAVRNWLSFLKSRTDPASFHDDAIHCQHLYNAGIYIPTETIEQDLGNRRFCLKSKVNLMDPLNLPSSIFLLPCSERDRDDQTSSPEEIAAAMAGLAVAKLPNAAVYTMALERMNFLATLALTTLSNYRFGPVNVNLCSGCGLA
jgi:hypothetical protein